MNARVLRLAARLTFFVAVASCAGAPDDALTLTRKQAIVGPNDPLPIPTNTVGPPDLIDTTNKIVVGSIPMSSGVSADGQAWAHLAINVAPGRRGMEPDVALDYHSRAGNGLVGVGWSLSGFSQIAPCAHRFAVDGYAGLGARCLDGEPLKPLGTNVWTTEHDRFVRIMGKPTSPTDPTIIYDAYQKDGRILHYYGGGGLLSQIEDRYGNTINYTYNSSAGGGGYAYPQSIDYTASNTVTTLTANRHVQFTYEARSDIEHAFFPVESRCAQRLKTIEVWGPDASMKNVLLRRYTLSYATAAQSSISGRSLLASITLGDASGNRIGSTDFTWEQGTPGFVRTETSVTDYDSSDPSAGYSLVDVNGDGFADLLYLVKDANGKPDLVVRLWNNGHGDFDPINDLYLPPTKGFGGFFTFPLPAITDVKSPPGIVLWETPVAGGTTFPVVQDLTAINNGANVTPGAYYRFAPTADTIFPADVDGDGLADMVLGWTLAGPQSVFQYSRNLAQSPANFDTPVNIPVPSTMVTGKAVLPGVTPQFRGVDFAGDGRQGMIVCYPSNPGSPTFLVNMNGATHTTPA